MTGKWHEIAQAPIGEVVETKIDDEHGERNIALLKRDGRLWFFPDGSMYVYYTPTHFRWPTPEQIEGLAQKADGQAREHIERAASFRASLR